MSNGTETPGRIARVNNQIVKYYPKKGVCTVRPARGQPIFYGTFEQCMAFAASNREYSAKYSRLKRLWVVRDGAGQVLAGPWEHYRAREWLIAHRRALRTAGQTARVLKKLPDGLVAGGDVREVTEVRNAEGKPVQHLWCEARTGLTRAPGGTNEQQPQTAGTNSNPGNH